MTGKLYPQIMQKIVSRESSVVSLVRTDYAGVCRLSGNTGIVQSKTERGHILSK